MSTLASSAPSSQAALQEARVTRFLQGIWKRVKPMTHHNDLLLVVDSARNLMWFSHHDQRILASDIHTEAKLQTALDSRLPNNEELRVYLWKIISQFEDAGAPLKPGTFSFGGLEYLCRGHCLLNNGHRLIALVFSPADHEAENGLMEHSDESSSSVNRASDFDTNGEFSVLKTPLQAGANGAANAAHGMHEFFPSVAHSEVTYYYSLLPRSEEGHYKHVDRHASEKYTGPAASAVDVDIEDPDETVPEVQSSARRISTANANGIDDAQARQQAAVVRKPTSSVAPGHSCQECGTTQSPEWRKGPNGSKTLCNACGLRYAKRLRQR